MNEMKWNRLGIALKTSISSGVVVFLFLSVSCFLLVRFESKIVDFIIQEHITKINDSISNQGEEQKKVFQNNSEIISRILGGISVPFINDVNDAGCMEALKAFMDFPSITAIQIIDEDGQAFAAAWKAPAVTASTAIPDNINPNAKHSLPVDVVHDNRTIGKITVYYTDKFLTEKLNQNRDKALSEVASFRETINERIQTAVFNQVIAVICIILSLIATITICLKRVVTTPLNRVVNNLRDIAKGEGDLTVRLNIKTRDEIGELGKWFDLFMENLQTLVISLIKNAEDVNTSSHDLAGLSEKMQLRSGDVTEKSNAVTAAVEEMSSSMNTIAAAMDQSSTNIGTVAKSTEEINLVLNEISERAGKAGKITEEAVSQASSASQKVEKLGNAARTIDTVIDTINDISEQTNLLALNATIEAARAGEAGKGFAVVASEIKELANQTTVATQDIKQSVNEIQESTNETVVEITKINKIIDDVNEIVGSIEEEVEAQSATTQEITNNITQASQGIQEINNNVAQSSAVSGEIAKEMAEVNTVAHKMSGSSSQVNDQAGDLSTLAGQLKDMVGKFKA